MTIDELLSSEKLLSIAERENKATLRNMCDLLFGLLDIFAFVLIVLPLYPNTVNGFVYSVNLFTYTQTTALNRSLHWFIFIFLVVIGFVKLILTKLDMQRYNKIVTEVSMLSSIISVLLPAITREPYAVVVAFLLLVMKGISVYAKFRLNVGYMP